MVRGRTGDRRGLKRAFRLRLEQERFSHIPIIMLLAEHTVREGFVEPVGFGEIVKNLSPPLDDVAPLALSAGGESKRS